MNFRPSKYQARSVVVVGGARTVFSKAGMDLSPLSAVDLGVFALQEALAQSGVSASEVEHVVIGNVAQPANAANISRVIGLYAGVPARVPGFTVQRNCASGLESVAQACNQIATGQADVVVAGGTESMSNIPLLFSDDLKEVFFGFAFAKNLGARLQALMKLRLPYLKPIIGLQEGLTDPVSGMIMGMTAEQLARDWHISRQEQDEFALWSHQKAVAAKDRLREESTPVYVPPRFKRVVADDVGPREDQSLEKLGRLKPYFDRRHGTVTVGNSCPVTDGAAMLVLMSEEKAKADGYKILARIRSIEFSGCEPSRMGLGPAFASPRAMDEAGVHLSDIDLIEINEAFAAQVIACERAFESEDFAKDKLNSATAIGKIDRDKLNVNGGAIALGHPVGTTGTRLVWTLIHELRRRQKSLGLATMCVGGGQGGAAVIEAAS